MKTRIAIIMICGWILATCSGEEQEKDLLDILEQERAGIRAFLAASGATTITPLPYLSKKGQLIDTVYLLDNTPPTAANTPLPGDLLLHDYTLQRLDGSYIESTDPTVDADTFRYAVRAPIYHRVDTAKHYDYIAHALARVAEGTTARLVVPSILLDKSGRTSLYTLATRRLVRDLFAYEKTVIQDYINAAAAISSYQDGNGDTLVHTLVRVAGTGDRLVQPGDSLTFLRVCFLLRENNTLHEAFSLDTITTASFDPARLEIPATGAAIARLREGDEADILIPSILAFDYQVGYHPADTRKKIPWIPPYSTLLYAVKVEKVRDNSNL